MEFQERKIIKKTCFYFSFTIYGLLDSDESALDLKLEHSSRHQALGLVSLGSHFTALLASGLSEVGR